jgi:putative flavoprotein involved in K+ transport
VQWWLHASGVLDECIEDVDDAERVRRLPSPQLVGRPDHATLDLNALSDGGVRLAGRLAGIRDRKVQFSGSLRNVCALADLKMRRMLRAFDDWAANSEAASQIGPAEEFESTIIDPSVPLALKLGDAGIRSIVWATGYRPDYSWLDVPVFDRKGRLKHDGGVVSAPGLYVLGLPFLLRRKSSFIHGAEDDVRDIVGHLKSYLDECIDSHTVRIAI